MPRDGSWRCDEGGTNHMQDFAATAEIFDRESITRMGLQPFQVDIAQRSGTAGFSTVGSPSLDGTSGQV